MSDPFRHAYVQDPFAALRDERRWLAWRWEERGGKPTKIPYAASRQGGPGKSNDPTTWGTYAQAEARARSLQDGRTVGVGIVLGDLGNGTGLTLAGLDLDSSLDADGQIAPWAAAIVAAVGSYGEISPSCCGLKLSLYLDNGDVRWFLDLIGVAANAWGTKRGIPGLSGANHGAGIELYCAGRFFTVTGRHWPDTPADIVLLNRARLEALAALIPAATSSRFEHGGVGGNDNGSGPGRDTSRSAKAYRAAWAARAATYEEMCEALRNHPDPEIGDWVRDKGEPNNERELWRIWDKLQQGDGVGLKDFHAFMPAHKYVFVPTRDLWPAASVNSRLPPVPLTKADGSPVLDKKGKQIKLPANLWLDQNQPVEQMVWAPGEPLIIEDKLLAEGGWIERNGTRSFNLYRPPPPITGDPSRAGRWLDHVAKVYPDDVEHIVRWLAHRVQRPWEKINHCLVLGGLQGIGKDSLLEPVVRAVGPWNFQEANPQQILGRFNKFLKGVIVRISEAHDLGEFDRFTFYEHMKTISASPPYTLRIDEKHMAEYYILNCVTPVITTNHQTDGVYLPEDDRRNLVTWSHLTKEDFEVGYWTGLWGWYDSGGAQHAAAYLRDYDLSGFDAKAPPPQTLAFRQVVGAGRTPEDAELADVLDAIGEPEVKEKDRDAVSQPNVVTIAAMIYHAAQNAKHLEFADWLRDRKNRRNIPHRMEACGYVAVHNPAAKDGLWKIKGRRVVVYGKVGLRAEDQIRMLKEEWRRSVYDEMERTVDRPNGYSNYGSNYDDR